MQIKKFVVLVIIVVGVLIYHENFEVNNYNRDFNFIYDLVEKSYPDFTEHKKVSQWLSQRNLYQNEIAQCKNDQEFFDTMQKIVSPLRSGHFHFISPEEYRWLYTASKVGGQGKTLPDREKRFVQTMTSKEMVHRYGFDQGELDQEAKQQMASTDRNLTAMDIIPGKVGYIQVKQMITVNDNEAVFHRDDTILTDYLSKIKDYKVLLVDLRDNYGGSPYYWKEFLLPMLAGGDFQSTYYYFVKDESYEKYVNYDFKGFMDSTISDFKHLDIVLANERDREAFHNLCTNYQKCYVYHEQLQTISKKYDKSLQFHGKIYFLINQNSASATDALARFIKANHIGTLAGSPTHGTGNEMVYMTTLPKTQYMIRSIISHSWGKGMSLEQSCKVEPDIFVPNSEVGIFTSHGVAMCSNDQVIQKVLKLEGFQN